MTSHTTATRKHWLAARIELLEAEKELTRRSDAVARQRQELPWVPVENDYRFETDAGAASLAELFSDHSQLIVYHFMFGLSTRAAARRARRSPMASTVSPSTWSTMTSG